MGRLHRLHDGKREVRVYDYADLNVPMLARMFDRRCRGYEAVGYTILLPASAVPGWPAEVPLPVDPQWKSAYAASVRRLVRDGVDVPLAKLFVDAAQPLVARRRRRRPGAERQRGVPLSPPGDAARRRRAVPPQRPVADSLSTAGGKWKWTCCAPKAAIAIELDGPQHLDSLEAYRRDRRKDVLLQENGYFVLRFLAEDVGQQLDTVLDAIQRAIAQRRRR